MKKSAVAVIHIIYWGGYALLLVFIYSLLTMVSGNRTPPGAVVLYTKMILGFGIVPGITSFYFSYFFLFTKFLSKKKILLLCIYGLLGCVFCGLLGEITLSVMLGGVGDNRHDVFFPNDEPTEMLIALVLTTFVAFVNVIIGLVTRGFITAYGDIKLKEDLNKKNYEMELALVKSQINPHFLFNTINNIDVLIEKDAVKASAYLNKLSDIMRFMLYETKTEHIPLSTELTYIEKYIDLQKIRTANEHYVSYMLNGNPGGVFIAPMLFIPFIENAFKHAENKRTGTAIRIRVSIEQEMIIFECENSYVEKPEMPGQSGLGNGLIKKRIELLYPGKHTLEITDKENVYGIKLSLVK